MAPKKITSYDKITDEWRVYILPLVNYNVYWPLMGQLYFMTSFLMTFCAVSTEGCMGRQMYQATSWSRAVPGQVPAPLIYADI